MSGLDQRTKARREELAGTTAVTDSTPSPDAAPWPAIDGDLLADRRARRPPPCGARLPAGAAASTLARLDQRRRAVGRRARRLCRAGRAGIGRRRGRPARRGAADAGLAGVVAALAGGGRGALDRQVAGAGVGAPPAVDARGREPAGAGRWVAAPDHAARGAVRAPGRSVEERSARHGAVARRRRGLPRAARRRPQRAPARALCDQHRRHGRSRPAWSARCGRTPTAPRASSTPGRSPRPSVRCRGWSCRATRCCSRSAACCARSTRSRSRTACSWTSPPRGRSRPSARGCMRRGARLTGRRRDRGGVAGQGRRRGRLPGRRLRADVVGGVRRSRSCRASSTWIRWSARCRCGGTTTGRTRSALFRRERHERGEPGAARRALAARRRPRCHLAQGRAAQRALRGGRRPRGGRCHRLPGRGGRAPPAAARADRSRRPPGAAVGRQSALLGARSTPWRSCDVERETCSTQAAIVEVVSPLAPGGRDDCSRDFGARRDDAPPKSPKSPKSPNALKTLASEAPVTDTSSPNRPNRANRSGLAPSRPSRSARWAPPTSNWPSCSRCRRRPSPAGWRRSPTSPTRSAAAATSIDANVVTACTGSRSATRTRRAKILMGRDGPMVVSYTKHHRADTTGRHRLAQEPVPRRVGTRRDQAEAAGDRRRARRRRPPSALLSPQALAALVLAARTPVARLLCPDREPSAATHHERGPEAPPFGRLARDPGVARPQRTDVSPRL